MYHINTIDEVTQWEVIGCVEKITEHYLVPVLKDLMTQYPFRVLGFHSDNGSEYVNKRVVRLGYYVGYLAIEQLLKQYNLRELAEVALQEYSRMIRTILQQLGQGN